MGNGYQYRYHNTTQWWDCDRAQAYKWLHAGYFDPQPALDHVDSGHTVHTSKVMVRTKLLPQDTDDAQAHTEMKTDNEVEYLMYRNEQEAK